MLTVRTVVNEYVVLGVTSVESPLRLEHQAIGAGLGGHKSPVLRALVGNGRTGHDRVRVRDVASLPKIIDAGRGRDSKRKLLMGMRTRERVIALFAIAVDSHQERSNCLGIIHQGAGRSRTTYICM